MTANSRNSRTKPVRVLLITGGHDFQKGFYDMMDNLPGIIYTEVKHPDALAMFRAENRRLYDVILLYDMPEAINEQEKRDYVDCLKEGKGLVVLHHAYCSYQGWYEYEKIVGGRYHQKEWKDGEGKTHPASSFKHDVSFTVKVADKKHPVTKGVTDFEILDETYRNGTVNPGVHVLLATDEPSSTPSVAWTNKYGKSKIVTILLGHDQHSWQNVAFTRLLNQAVHWTKR
jgi:type 1 glutamine amidotransferase